MDFKQLDNQEEEFKVDDDVAGLDSDDDDDKGLDDDLDEQKEDKHKDASDALQLRDALRPLACSDRFSDVTFLVKGEKIRAHKVVLAARSRVFEAMLYPAFDDEVEKEDLQIEIHDIEPSIFKKLLLCTYSDSADMDAESIGGCLTAAKRFQVDSLLQDCMRFLDEGITLQNACSLFNTAPTELGDASFGLKFIEENTEDVIKQPGFVALSKDRLKDILKSDNLSVEEIDLFNAVIRWAAAECKRQSLEYTPENQKKILEDVIPLIRFASMEMPEIATHVAATGLLSTQQLLQIYTYLGSQKQIPLQGFNGKERQGSLMSRWALSKTKKSARIVLSNKNHTATCNAGNHSYIVGDTPLKKKGKHYWRVHIQQIQNTTWVMVGIGADKTYADASYNDPTIWGWSSANQTYTAGASSGSAATNWTVGTVLDACFDSKKKTFTVYNHLTRQTITHVGITVSNPTPHFNIYGGNKITVYPIRESAYKKQAKLPKKF